MVVDVRGVVVKKGRHDRISGEQILVKVYRSFNSNYDSLFPKYILLGIPEIVEINQRPDDPNHKDGANVHIHLRPPRGVERPGGSSNIPIKAFGDKVYKILRNNLMFPKTMKSVASMPCHETLAHRNLISHFP